jgi:hypothetical protein
MALEIIEECSPVERKVMFLKVPKGEREAVVNANQSWSIVG